jgi:hypothetical protein
MSSSIVKKQLETNSIKDSNEAALKKISADHISSYVRFVSNKFNYQNT